MTTEQINEGNRLIAEFMWGPPMAGETFDPYDRPNIWEVADDNRGIFWSLSNYYEATGQHIEDELFFHASWDWLMSVVEKIDGISLPEYKEGFDFVMRDRCLSYVVSADVLKEVAVFDSKENRIESVWGCVVEFIKWYNENK